MPFATIQDAPATEEMYQDVRAQLGDETPKGLLAHVALKAEGGLQYIDVWETEADWDRFHAEKLGPAVDAMLTKFGVPRPVTAPARQTPDVVGVWIP